MDYSFFDNVYDVVREIPEGRVTTYGAIAKLIGTGKSSRMVGYALNQCAGADPPVPAHRVVNRNGQLTGKRFFDTPTRMQELLEAEGVEVKDDRVVEFEQLYWDPAKELEI